MHLEEKAAHLVKLGISIGMRHEGAVHAHTRKALAAGWSPDELELRGSERTVTTEGME